MGMFINTDKKLSLSCLSSSNVSHKLWHYREFQVLMTNTGFSCFENRFCGGFGGRSVGPVCVDELLQLPLDPPGKYLRESDLDSNPRPPGFRDGLPVAMWRQPPSLHHSLLRLGPLPSRLHLDGLFPLFFPLLLHLRTSLFPCRPQNWIETQELSLFRERRSGSLS